jgi:hypothetical protein
MEFEASKSKSRECLEQTVGENGTEFQVNGVPIDEIVTTGYDSNCSEDYQLEAP